MKKITKTKKVLKATKIITDHELIMCYRTGDEKSFEVLVSRYMNPLYRFAFSYVKNQQAAEDIVQEVFVKVWRNIKKIDKNKNFKSWIYTIAKNTALDSFKKKKSVPFSDFETENGKNVLLERLVDQSQGPEAISQSLEVKNAFLNAIGKLSEKYKMVLSLYYYNLLNFREIAELLKEPVNTIKSRHRRGVILLKRIITQS